jgi:hypothetical protein
MVLAFSIISDPHHFGQRSVTIVEILDSALLGLVPFAFRDHQ